MKKINKLIIIIGFLLLSTFVYASVTTDMNTWWANLNGYNQSNAAKAKYQDVMTQLDQQLDELQTMNQNGDFDKLPVSVKTKFIWAWQQLDTVRDTLKADQDFMDALNWKPGD